MKKICLAMLLLVTFSSFSQTTTIFVTRHAEKADNSKDTKLSSDGLARAEALRDMLNDVKVDAIYSTPYNRTKQTVSPVAKAKGISVTEYDASKPYGEFVAEILDAQRGKTILIAGHSNTVPEILKVLTNGEFTVSIGENQFDNLFIVTIPNGGKPTTVSLKYGKLTP